MSQYPHIPMLSMQVSQYLYFWIHLYRRLFGKKRTFIFNGREFRYFEHPYNRTWLNERSIEIPIVWELMKEHDPATVLEIGNVMPHYFKFGHVVVDKYERGRNVVQRDVVSLDFPKRFSLILSISTLEHVGWDETPRVPGKHLLALKNLRQLLSEDGLLAVTLPLGYNHALDEDLYAGRLGFDEIFYLKRTALETWQQADRGEVRGVQYGKPFPAANALVVGFLRA